MNTAQKSDGDSKSPYYSFYIDTPNTVRVGKISVWKEVTSNADGSLSNNKLFKDKMYSGYPFISSPVTDDTDTEKLIRRGPLVIDIDSGKARSAADALKIIDHFEAVYGVPVEAWVIFLSGSKGVHLELNELIIGTEAGSPVLPIAYKRVVTNVEAALGVKTDTSMYNMGCPKPYRQPNVLRDNGCSKTRISYEDLYEIIDDETYDSLCVGTRDYEGDSEVDPSTVCCQALKEKTAGYIRDASEDRNAVVGTAIDRKAFANKIKSITKESGFPPCIERMNSGRYESKSGATFNDVAIQLTSYFVAVGMSEGECLVAARHFISSYPSSSLNTDAKREANFINRYRSISSGGHVFSCNAVKSLKLSGFWCSVCRFELCKNIPDKKIKDECNKPVQEEANDEQSNIVTTTTLSEKSNCDREAIDDLTLSIDESIFSSCGSLIESGLNGLAGPGLPKVRQYNIATVLSFIAAACAGKITLVGRWPNIYHCKVGYSSGGKSASSEALANAVLSVNPAFLGPSSFSSGQAILSYMVEKPQYLSLIDEVEWMFRGNDTGGSSDDERKTIIMEAHTKAGVEKYIKWYAKAANAIEVSYPCLNILGCTTDEVIKRITYNDFASGFIPRWEFFAYTGKDEYRGFSLNPCANNDICYFAKRVNKLNNGLSGDNDRMGATVMGSSPAALSITDEGVEYTTSLSRYVTDAANLATENHEKTVQSRTFESAIKYAMLRHVSCMFDTSFESIVNQPVSKESLEWGWKLASNLRDWKLDKLLNRISTGPFHSDCETFKTAVDSCMRSGHRATVGVMSARKRSMRNWDTQYVARIVSALVARGEIEIDISGRTDAYVLL